MDGFISGARTATGGTAVNGTDAKALYASTISTTVQLVIAERRSPMTADIVNFPNLHITSLSPFR